MSVCCGWYCYVLHRGHDQFGVTSFGEEDQEGKVSLSSHNIKGTYQQHDLSLLMLTLINWSQNYFVPFFISLAKF